MSFDLTTQVQTYSGTTFFDDWTYYGAYDNTTLGDVIVRLRSNERS